MGTFCVKLSKEDEQKVSDWIEANDINENVNIETSVSGA